MSISATHSSHEQEARQQRAVELFAAGWQHPGPHAWDSLLDRHVELRQPLMPDGVGRAHWQREITHLLALLPDLRGEVLEWTGAGDSIHIHVRCTASLGGAPLIFEAVDRLALGPEGTVVQRDSYLDPTPLMLALLTRPRSWGAWWRSGAAPLRARRALIPTPRPVAPAGQTPSIRHADRTHFGGRLTRTLGAIRTCVGLTALISPSIAFRSLGERHPPVPTANMAMRAFGIRDLAIGLATFSKDHRTSRTGTQLGLLADAADTATFLAGSDANTTGTPTLIAAAAATFAIAGAVAIATTPTVTE